MSHEHDWTLGDTQWICECGESESVLILTEEQYRNVRKRQEAYRVEFTALMNGAMSEEI